MEYLEKLNAKLVEVKKEIDNFEKNISELKEKYPEISAYELATKSNVNEYIEKIVEIGKKQILLQSKKSEYEKLNNEKIWQKTHFNVVSFAYDCFGNTDFNLCRYLHYRNE